MAEDFIPSTDAGKRAWAANFNTKIGAAPTAVGLTAAMATAFDGLFDAFDAALTAATNPSTRTSTTVIAKDVARDDMVSSARELARIIQAFPAITPTQLNDLGLTVRDTSPSTIGKPTSKPVANIERIMNLAHVLRIRDESTPTSNAKPFGAIAGEVYAKIGAASDPEPLTIADCKFMGLATRIPFTAEFAPTDAGKTVWYIVRWINARGEAGPQSDQISGTIAA